VLSVIVPTLLSDGGTPRTLLALSQQDIDFTAVEVLVVADGTARGSLESMRALKMPFPLTVIEQPHRGQAAARNRGAAEASGDRLLFLDDDMDLAPDFLRQINRHFEGGADVVLTDIRIGEWVQDTLPIRVARRLEQSEREARRLGTPLVFEDMVFAATAVRRETFERAGGFDTSFTEQGAYGNEDIELGYRLIRDGADVRHAREAVAHTDARHELPLLLKRARQVGRNDVLLARKHPELAEALFGRKLVYSRTHRLVGTAVLRVPALARGEVLLRWPVGRFVHDGSREGPIRTRLWLALRSMRYWRGVAEAGGRTLALAGRAMVRRTSDATRSRPAGGRPGTQPRGR
jgi:glycosyltransferase involved in cell wall biosynthesis